MTLAETLSAAGYATGAFGKWHLGSSQGRLPNAQGGSMAGWSLYAHEGRLTYHYNFMAVRQYAVAASSPLPSGKHQVRMEFTYDGGGLGKGAMVTLFVDGKQVGEGRIDRTIKFNYALDETLEVGCDLGEPVSPDYGARGNEFNGTVKWVQIDIDAAAKDVDHMIGAGERFQLIMAKQ